MTPQEDSDNSSPTIPVKTLRARPCAPPQNDCIRLGCVVTGQVESLVYCNFCVNQFLSCRMDNWKVTSWVFLIQNQYFSECLEAMALVLWHLQARGCVPCLHLLQEAVTGHCRTWANNTSVHILLLTCSFKAGERWTQADAASALKTSQKQHRKSYAMCFWTDKICETLNHPSQWRPDITQKIRVQVTRTAETYFKISQNHADVGFQQLKWSLVHASILDSLKQPKC